MEFLAPPPPVSDPRPAPIQAQAWGVAFGGADMVAIAKTGSGKTLGFLIPGLRRMAEGGGRGLRVLVLSPTRELAVQTLEEAERFGGPAGFRAVCAYGGASRRAQVWVQCPRMCGAVREKQTHSIHRCSLTAVVSAHRNVALQEPPSIILRPRHWPLC